MDKNLTTRRWVRQNIKIPVINSQEEKRSEPLSCIPTNGFGEIKFIGPTRKAKVMNLIIVWLELHFGVF